MFMYCYETAFYLPPGFIEWMLSNSLPYVADPKRSEQFCTSKGNELISTSQLLSKFAGAFHVQVPLLSSTTQFLNISVWPA